MHRFSQFTSRRFAPLSLARLRQGVFSTADQALSVGGMFLINVALARTRSKEEYGMFALSYSVFTFLSGLHNAALLETYTVYGAGRYRQQHPEYAWLIWRSNMLLGLALSALLLLAWRVLAWTSPGIASYSLLGLAVSAPLLLMVSLLRRILYVQGKPRLAAKLSLISFCTVALLLSAFIKTGILNGFSAFLIGAFGGIVGTLFLRHALPRKGAGVVFTHSEPRYWAEHWRYARWVVGTAFVFQFTTQGYYWLVAGSLSLKEVAELRALYMLVSPIEQVLVAVAFVVLPMLAAYFASKQIAELISLWRKYLLLTILFTACFAGLIRLIGARVVHVIYGGRFDNVAAFLGILAFLPLVMGIGNTINAALKSMEKSEVVFYAYLASGIATFLGGMPLVIHFGLRGAVYGMLLSATTYTLTLAAGFFLSLQFRLRVLPLATQAR